MGDSYEFLKKENNLNISCNSCLTLEKYQKCCNNCYTTDDDLILSFSTGGLKLALCEDCLNRLIKEYKEQELEQC